MFGLQLGALRCIVIVGVAVLFIGNSLHGESFFEIYSLKASKGSSGPTKNRSLTVEAKVFVREAIRSKNTTIKLYFFDASGKKVSEANPATIIRPGESSLYDVPLIYLPKKPTSIYFSVPKGFPDNGSMLLAFGDQYEIAAKALPETSPSHFDFPEKALFMRPVVGGFKREPVANDKIEYTVKTKNPSQPAITFFVRFPSGAFDSSKAKGVMAICVLANGVGEIRNMLARMDDNEGLDWKFKYAEEHQLTVVLWGSHTLWDPRVNFDELDKVRAAEINKSFDEVADAWADGIRQLGRDYSLPQQNFLLSGISGSAQWAHRLALRKPEFFLAVDVHVPSSFDRPTVEANRVLWCVTTGELEIGYGRSLRFFAECSRLGYPIVYKAYIGLGHEGSPLADRLGQCFFDYALSFGQQRIAYDKMTLNAPKTVPGPNQSLKPWLKSFQTPDFVGDAVNQDMYPIDKIAEVPSGFRVALPTKEIAETWNLR